MPNLFINKGNKIDFFFKFDQYNHDLRRVTVGILLRILPHAGRSSNYKRDRD
jgi:hypothetical protein